MAQQPYLPVSVHLSAHLAYCCSQLSATVLCSSIPQRLARHLLPPPGHSRFCRDWQRLPYASVSNSTGNPRVAGPRKYTYTCSLHNTSAMLTDVLIFTNLLATKQDLIAAAKSLQSCPTLCDAIDGGPPGSPVPGILQARTLEWVAISFSNAWKGKVKPLSRVRLFVTPWSAAYQAPPSMGFSRQEYWSRVPLPSPRIWLVYEIISTNLIIRKLKFSFYAGYLSVAFRALPIQVV